MPQKVYLAFIKYILICVSIASTTGYACVCSGTSGEKKLQGSSLIFMGTPIEINKKGPRRGGTAKFKVTKVYKGPELQTVEIQTSNSSCGYRFRDGPDQVIFASGSESTGYTTHQCQMYGAANADYEGYAKRAESYISLLKEKPDDQSVLAEQSDFYLHYNEHDKAQQSLTKLIVLQPNDFSLHMKRGGSYYESELFDKALADFDAALTIKENDDEAKVYRNNTLLKLGRADELSQKRLDFSGYQQNQRGEDIDFSKLNLRDATFTNSYLNRAQFSGKDLTGADFTNAYLHHPNFTNANLTNVKFSSTHRCDGSIFLGAILEDTNFSGAQLTSSNFEGVDLSNSDFSNSKLYYSNFKSAQINDANFTNADLTKTDLSGTTWKKTPVGKALFQRADLKNSIFDRVDLSEVNFTVEDKHSYYERFTILTNTDFSTSKLGTNDLGVSVYTCTTKFPKDYEHLVHSSKMFPLWSTDCGTPRPPTKIGGGHKFAWGPRVFDVSVYRVDFRNMDLSGFWFNSSDLLWADFTDANLHNFRVYEVDFSHSIFKNVELHKAEFGKTKLDGAQFENVSFKDVEFKEVSFYNATFTNVTFENSCASRVQHWPRGFDPLQHNLTECK